MTNKRRKRRRKKRTRYNRRSIFLLGFALAVAVLVIGGIEFSMQRSVKKRDDGTILQGIYIGDIDVSGMTKKEAATAVEATLKMYCAEKIEFQLETGGVVKAELGELGLDAKDIEGIVKKAERYGKRGNTVSAYKIIRNSEKGKLRYEIPLQLQVSKKKVTEVLQERSREFLSLPVDAYVTQKDGAVTVVADQKGEAPDAAAVTKNLNKRLNQDWDKKGFALKVAVVPTDPEITKEALAEVTDLLGTHTTFYGADGTGRSQNVETGAGHINGIFVQPGEQVSANALMEPYTYENGYTEAASYESNKVVDSMGGGICQVSTTLYNALLYAELEIVERYPHSMLVGYAEPSKDAAIAENLLDLVFKNNLEHPVFIESVLSEGNLTFNIYGKETRDSKRSLEFISETTETTETTEKEFTATEDSIGYFELKTESRPRITAQLWKVVYENGEEVSRDTINYSTYIPAPSVYGVGTVSDDAETTEKIKNAISAQDESAIRSIIEEYQKKKNDTDSQQE